MTSQLTNVDQPGQNEQQSSTGQPIIPVDVPTYRTEPMNYTCTIQNQGMAPISRLYMHHAIPLGATVPDNVRRLIWADEFVELSTLLPETMDKALKPKNVVIENLANPVQTVKDHNTTISSLDLWQTAFSILTNALLWVVHRLVRFLNGLVLLWNGLASVIYAQWENHSYFG